MKEDKCFDTVTEQKVEIPDWRRGQESLVMMSPRPLKLAMLGIGGSEATPPEGIEAEVISVSDFEELEQRKEEVKGKIVSFNCHWKGYPTTVAYRAYGADKASAFGALAVLVRSVSPDSMNAPHAGTLEYSGKQKQIPACCLSEEASTLLHRLCKRGKKVIVRLKMDSKYMANRLSRNIIAELKGTNYPDEVIAIGGHIDSWDVGTGAHDDAQACIATWEAVRVLHRLKLRPKRTIRVICWVDEEMKGCGNLAYKKSLSETDIAKHVAAIETDWGVAQAQGFEFLGCQEAVPLLKQVGQLLLPLRADKILLTGRTGVDIEPLSDAGIPCLLLRPTNLFATSGYWKYHHCEGDTFDKINRKDLEQNVSVLAVMAYVLADMPIPLPRGPKAEMVDKEMAWPSQEFLTNILEKSLPSHDTIIQQENDGNPGPTKKQKTSATLFPQRD
eukprot:gb/GEZN01006634.1/.p1 GENE.gb/GEZN01006634.1/~~gb/GEZN01006634.1/.p1  ORF type:complete len:503 (+),score=68.97 gb/GEZN01006634.1/:180-1511(+)